MTDGEKMLQLAETRIGEKYVHVCVPKNNKNWHGPWDCAEFMSWLVYQGGGYLYGCVANRGDPAPGAAYTGAWQRDCNKIGKRIHKDQAAATVGAILLRFPPQAGAMGHIVVCDGKGGTVEAMGKNYGVRRGKIAGRSWHTGILLPDFSYREAGTIERIKEPTTIYAIGRPNMDPAVVKAIQRALKEKGVDPGPIDGEYSVMTAAAVAAYQTMRGLVADGEVGTKTARSLKVDLTP